MSMLDGALVLRYQPEVKRSNKVVFEKVYRYDGEETTTKYLDELTHWRQEFLNGIFMENDTAILSEQVLEQCQHYISLLQGLLQQSNLRKGCHYCWWNDIGKYTKTTLNDVEFELISILYNMALWLMNHAALLLKKNELHDDKMEQEAYKNYQRAAGIFKFIAGSRLSMLWAQLNSNNDGKKKRMLMNGDLRESVLGALIHQNMADGQSILVYQLLQKKHNNDEMIIGGFREVAEMYMTAYDGLAELDKSSSNRVHSWRLYLHSQGQLYFCLSHFFMGTHLSKNASQTGRAVRSLLHASECLQLASASWTDYVKVQPLKKLPHITMTMMNVFTNVQSQLKGELQTLQLQNNQTLFQPVPDAIPSLYEPQSFMEVEVYQLPPISSACNNTILQHLTVISSRQSSKSLRCNLQ